MLRRDRWYAEKRSSEKWSPEKKIPGEMVTGKNDPRQEWSPEKCPSKIVLCQKNARKFERLFYFYRLISLQKMFDIHPMILHAPNCRTLKESRKVCCRVSGFHGLITSQRFTHTPFSWTIFPRDHFSAIPIDRMLPGVKIKCVRVCFFVHQLAIILQCFDVSKALFFCS